MPEKAESPAGEKRAKGEQTVFPVTIKQINDASTGDDQVKIDGRDVNQVVIVGTVLTIDAQALAINYSMDDGTGRIDVRWWSDAENGESADEKRSIISEMTYARVVGKVRNFQGTKQIVAFDVRPVKDFNEVTYHMINAVQVHLAHTTAASAPVDNNGPGFGFGAAPVAQNTPAATGAAPMTGGADSNLNEIQKSVMEIIDQHGAGEMGCEFGAVKAQLGNRFDEGQLREAIEFLSSEGHLYSTIDEDHFKATASDY